MQSVTSPSPAGTVPTARRISSAVQSFLDATGLTIGYLICAPLALAALWAHRFPPGVDLPEHAELVRLWVDLRRGVPDVVNLYQLRTFTPYALAYIIAYPVAIFFGALASVKFVLSVAALGAPAMMTRWLRVVGGDPRLGVIGFAVVFGWAFLWGFMSHCLALGFMFGYLTAFEEQGEHPTWQHVLETVLWGVALFFCHGVTFGLAIVCAGMRLVLRPRPLAMWRAWLQFVPLGLLTLAWMRTQEKAVSDKPGIWLMDFGRLKILFSGIFCIQVNTFWAEVVALTLVACVLFVMPKINWRPAAWVPFIVAASLFAVLPGHIVATELIGPRFGVYVQAFAPGIWLARPGRWDRHFEWTPVVLVVVCLIVLNVRISRFNREIDQFREVAAKATPGADVQTYQPKAGGGSQIFGYRGQALSAAWLAAENGGIMEDDYAARFNMPVQRKKVNFPRRYRYIFTMSDSKKVTETFPDAELRAHSGPWSLYERKPLAAGKFPIIRSAQGWDELQVDKSLVKEPLTVAGVTYDHGLGTHADSWIELRGTPGTKLETACGMDDSGRDEARINCGVRQLDGKVLFRSGLFKKGDEPIPVSATFPPDGILILEMNAIGLNKGTHGDWLDLR